MLGLYPLSHGHIAGLSVELLEVTCSVKVPHWITGISPTVFSQSIYIKNKSTYLLYFGGIIFEALDFKSNKQQIQSGPSVDKDIKKIFRWPYLSLQNLPFGSAPPKLNYLALTDLV